MWWFPTLARRTNSQSPVRRQGKTNEDDKRQAIIQGFDCLDDVEIQTVARSQPSKLSKITKKYRVWIENDQKALRPPARPSTKHRNRDGRASLDPEARGKLGGEDVIDENNDAGGSDADNADVGAD